MSPEEAAFEFFADCDTFWQESVNPMGSGLDDERRMRVLLGNLGQLRRFWQRARAQLEEAAR